MYPYFDWMQNKQNKKNLSHQHKIIFKYVKNICEKGQVLNTSQLNPFLGVVPECYIFHPLSSAAT